MRQTLINFATCLAALFSSSSLSAATGMSLASAVMSSRYCSAPNGNVVLDVKVGFTFRNNGDSNVALPRFGRISGYSLFHGADEVKADQPILRSSFHLQDIFKVLEADTANPSSLLFETVLPGGVATRVDEVSVPLSTSKKGSLDLLGTAPLIQFIFDNWPGRRHIASSRHVWAAQGKL